MLKRNKGSMGMEGYDEASKWWGLALTILLVCGVALAGCGGGGSATKVKIGEVTRSIFYAPQYVALEKDF